jgi:beta-glucosidase
MVVSRGRWTNAHSLFAQINVTVKNEGDRTGSEVVQLYVSLPEIGLTTPKLQLRGFAKANNVTKGSTAKVTITLDKYAFSFWDDLQNCWKVPAGKYGVHVGVSSDNLSLHDTIELKETFTWKGL